MKQYQPQLDPIEDRYKAQMKQIEDAYNVRLKQIKDVYDARYRQIGDIYNARYRQIGDTFDVDPRMRAWQDETTQPWYREAEKEANEKNRALLQLQQDRDGAVAQCRRSVGELQTALTTDLTTAAGKVQEDIETTGGMDVAKR